MNSAEFPQVDAGPHQKAFVKAFFAAGAPQGFALRWPAGFGSMTAAIAIVHSCLQRNPKGRVLVLGPKALAEQTAYRLVSSGVRAEIVDRFFFRMLLDATPPGAEVWQGGNAFLLGIDFAKQEDVALSLCGVSWDLVVVIEADSLSGARENLLRKIVSASPQIRVLLLAGPATRALPLLGVSSWADDSLSLQGISSLPSTADLHPPSIKTIKIENSPVDNKLNESLDELLQSLPKDSKECQFLSRLIKSTRRSGFAALEGVLRRIRNEWAHGWSNRKSHAEKNDSDSDLIDIEHEWAMEFFRDSGAGYILTEILDQFEMLGADPKSTHLSELIKRSPSSRKTCVLSAYRATLSYLETALAESGAEVFAVHSGLSPEKAFEELEKFRTGDGLLLLTLAALRPGVDLSFVDSLIVYDTPSTDAKLKSIFECFEGPHRSSPLDVTVIDQAAYKDL